MASVGHRLRAPSRAEMGFWVMGRVRRSPGGEKEWSLRPMMALEDITTFCAKDTGGPQRYRHFLAYKTP